MIGKPGLLFSDLREASARRQAEWPGSEAADLSFRALEVGGETGELLEALKKYRRSQLGIKGSTATLDDIADEMADVAIALDLLAAKLDINLARAIVRKFNATSEKYELATRLDGLDQHTDDIAVERFAARMKAKLAQARREGMAGWDNPLACTTEHLAQLLIKHVHKGDPVDIANFAMMLSERGVEGNNNEITRHTAQPETEQEAVTQTLDPENTRTTLKALITLANSQCDGGQARIQFYSVDVDDTNVGHAGPVDTPLEGWLTDYFGHFLECRKCGCTETRPCVDGHGPCWWVEVDLCSHCADPAAAAHPSEELEP